MVIMSRRLWLVLAVVCACSSEPRPCPPRRRARRCRRYHGQASRVQLRGRGVRDGRARRRGVPFHSIVAYDYQVLRAFGTKVGDDDVLKTWLPASRSSTRSCTPAR
jgi:hypothetical protein